MTDQTSTAIHEAGHAVAHFRLNVLQGMATIKPKGGNLGSVSAEGKDHVWDAEYARKQVLCYCAGYAALIAADYSDEDAKQGADNDFNIATKLLAWLPLPSTLEEWLSKSVTLMSSPENIRAVDFVAKALMEHETLNADYVDMSVEYVDGKFTEKEWLDYLSWQHPEIFKLESQ